MKKFFVDIYRKFKYASVFKKILTILACILYIAIILLCSIRIEVDKTSPGEINRVESIIKIDGYESNTPIYSVSVYTYTKVSLLDYLISLVNDKVKIEKVDHDEDIFTINEWYKIDICAKEQSIQDAIIASYSLAKENGLPVTLESEYVGVRVAYIPSNYYNTGPESLQIGDIVTNVGGVNIVNDEDGTGMEKFRKQMEFYYNKCKLETGGFDSSVKSPNLGVIRNNEEIMLDNCNIILIAILAKISQNYGFDRVNEYYYYDYYNIKYDECVPKISLSNPTSVGPSAGFIQALYIYDALLEGKLLNEKRIIGTGTISIDGTIGKIGGLKQKLITASYYGMNYFFIPKSQEADDDIKVLDKLEPRYKTVYVSTLKEAVDFLLEAQNAND